MFRGIGFYLRKNDSLQTTGREFCSREFALSRNFLDFGFCAIKMRAHLHMNTMQSKRILSDADLEARIA